MDRHCLFLVYSCTENAGLTRAFKCGEEAAIIGGVVAEPGGKVLMETAVNGTRTVHMLVGDILPRIC